MADAKPFSDEEIEAIKEFNRPKETQCQTMTEASMIYAEEKRKAYIRRFLATIVARDKRIDKATARIHDLETEAVNSDNTIQQQAATIKRLKTAIHDCIERPKGVVPDSAIEFYDMRGPAVIE